MNNIVLFRGRSSAIKFSAAQALPAKVISPSFARAASAQRSRLIAVWHTNPMTGKLECFWTTERVAVSDEGDSHRAA